MIKPTLLSEILSSIEGMGKITGQDVPFSSVSIDSRTLKSGDLFVALQGPNFDGHHFVSNAAQNGASAALVSETQALDLPQLEVSDTRLALGKIGLYNRRQFSGALAAITGSSGKTTVKEMLALICNQCAPTLSTKGNLNNDFGAPLTLSRISADHRYAVIELGANAPGEILYTSTLAEPNVVILNNVTGAHLEGFGTLDQLAQAKGEIIQGLSSGGTVVINADDSYGSYWQQLAEGKAVLTFGLDTGADVSACNVQLSASSSRFDICLPSTTASICLHIPGKHHVSNALAAAAAAYVMGIPTEHIVAGLEAFKPIVGRGLPLSGYKGASLIDDSYNANPGSMRAAIDVLSAHSGKRILVIGDMGELGDKEEEFHAELGQYAKNQKIDCLLAVGRLTQYSCEAFGEGAYHFDDKKQLVEFLYPQLAEDVVVLFKGSRSARMETVLEACLLSEGVS